MEDTFYLSNMCPQNPNFNRGYWAKFEKYVRDLTKAYKAVHVFTGPLYLPKAKQNGQKWIKYQVIGKNEVSVPTPAIVDECDFREEISMDFEKMSFMPEKL